MLTCHSSPKENKNPEAIILHNPMVKKANMIEHRLNEIASNTMEINEDSVRVLKELLDQWKSDLIEVPGNENHYHHEHSHSHQLASDVTDEQMLEIQKELDARLSLIGKRATQLKPGLTHDEHTH
jgi:hypothetical protein